jgi:hypothetical protein
MPERVPVAAVLATPESESTTPALLPGRRFVAACVFLALVFDGVELGLMPVASLSVTRGILGEAYDAQLGAEWFAWLTAALMFGAAAGGIAFGHLGDRLGRVRALALSILFYSVFAGLGGLVQSMNQLLVLRFLVGLGVGGVWPNGISLASEFWPAVSKPMLSGVLGAAINIGILGLSQVARLYPITPDSWRWLFQWCAAPAALGLIVLWKLPESPVWLAAKVSGADSVSKPGASRDDLISRWPLLLVAILLGSIPLVGAWAASKWMIPWADAVAGAARPGYKATAQGYWAFGACLGGFLGALIAGRLGPRRSYALFGALSTLFTCGLFLGTRPLEPSFLPMVFAQGLAATSFFGWLPLYLPQMFPVRLRATGTGIAYNLGRFLTAFGVLGSSVLVRRFEGDYAAIGAAAGVVYALGIGAAWLFPREEVASDPPG